MSELPKPTAAVHNAALDMIHRAATFMEAADQQFATTKPDEHKRLAEAVAAGAAEMVVTIELGVQGWTAQLRADMGEYSEMIASVTVLAKQEPRD
jgi:hypothetical protein